MRPLRLFLPIVLVATATGCKVGSKWDPGITQSPLGATVEIRTDAATSEGELLLVRDDGIVILIDRQVRLSRWEITNRVRIRRASVSYAINGTEPSSPQREAMRKLSRYPHGLTSAQLEKLLASVGQTEILPHR